MNLGFCGLTSEWSLKLLSMPRASSRDQLIKAALKSFHAQGYKGTTIELIAEAAGIFKGSFYNHFSSKEALAIEIIALYEQGVTGNLSLKGPPSASKRLRNHFKFLATQSKLSEYMNGCLMSNFAVEVSQLGEPLRLALEQAFERWFAAIATVVSQAQAEGDIDPKQDPQQLARYLANSLEGATNYSKVVRNQQPIDDFFILTFPRIGER